MTAFNIQMNEELTPFHMIKEGNFQQYVSDVIGNIIYRLENIPHLQADNFVLLQVDFLEMFQAKNAVVALQPVSSHFYTLVTVFGEYMDGGVEYQVEIEGIHTTLESVLKEFDRHDYTYEGFSETF